MTKIGFSTSFKRALKKVINAQPELEPVIRKKFETFINDPFDPSLRTHKLTGNLKAYSSFRITYDIRVIFEFVTLDEALGTHDDVY